VIAAGPCAVTGRVTLPESHPVRPAGGPRRPPYRARVIAWPPAGVSGSGQAGRPLAVGV